MDTTIHTYNMCTCGHIKMYIRLELTKRVNRIILLKGCRNSQETFVLKLLKDNNVRYLCHSELAKK